MKKVIVVGAGILGASTAYQLAKMGAEVLIIDRNDKGQATAAAAGIICPWISQRRNQAWYQLAKAGARYYPGLIKELESEGETNTGYAQVGALSIHTDMEKMKNLEERVQKRKPDASEIGDISRLDEKETRKHFPPLAEGYHSVHIGGAARVDGRALRDALKRSAQRNGATLLTGDAALQFNSNRVTGVTVGDETHSADKVIVCAGAWANQILKSLGVNFQVSFQKGQIVQVQLPDAADTHKWPVVIPPSDKYLLAFNDQRVLIGSTNEDDIDGYDVRVTARGVQELLNKGLEMAPGLADSTFLETRVGFRPFTPGSLPVIGSLPGWDDIIVANGLGASGLTMGPYIGNQLAKLALDMDLDIDLNDYDIQKAIGDN
ncbi:FAD-binding oxidoreductase [Bacillus sp. V59.32b]|uniref:NAD(P)/FAD-dependent oxidoreductase n=1 Tax=Bacillus sp. V59.32b TaxID=1758642 RepID=UPI000E3BE593|nr:FAD-dependent oxidoreductase [Bacillus sp. V59.32b]RFU68396.1 FAD-binding oxidoreductase [Bacillus sp. V59.32b]